MSCALQVELIGHFLGGCGPRAQGSDFLAKCVESSQQFIVALVGDRGIPGFNVEGAIRFEIAAMHVVNVFEALAMDDFDKFFACEGLALHCLAIDLAIADEYDGAAFERARKPGRTEEDADHEPVDGEETEGADDAARDGVVIANDGVLHSVGEREQDDEVEGVQLREFTFAKKAQKQHEHKVYDDRTQQLLEDRNRQMKHVVDYRCEDHAARIACSLFLCQLKPAVSCESCSYEVKGVKSFKIAFEGRVPAALVDQIFTKSH